MNSNLSIFQRLKGQRDGQRGVVMLEALLAILIFSIGILAVVGMQGSAVSAVTDAKYRSDASMLAGNLIGQMWASNRTGATLQANFQGGYGTNGPMYTAWLNNANSGVSVVLPGVASNPPQVSVNAGSGDVSITIFWTPPGDNVNGVIHSYNIVTNVQ